MKGGPNPKVFMILTIVTLLAGTGLSYMQYTSYSAVTADVDTLRKTAKNPTEVQADLDAISLKVEATKAKLTHLEAGVPAMEYVPTLLKELEALGKECGIEVTGVRPVPVQAKPAPKSEGGEKPKRKPYNELDIEVKGRGAYGSVMKFIDGLTKFPKIVAAKTVSMQPKIDINSGVGGAPKLDVTIELRSFLFPTDGDKSKDEPTESAEKTIDLSSRKRVQVN